MIRFLSETIVLAIHEDQVRLYGGSYGIRDANALDAALNMPKAQFSGEFLHPTIFHMAAAYGFHLCQNHPCANCIVGVITFFPPIFPAKTISSLVSLKGGLPAGIFSR